VGSEKENRLNWIFFCKETVLKTTLTIVGAGIIILIAVLFLGRSHIIDAGIRQQAEKIGNRFHHELLTDGKMHIFTVGTGSPNPNPRRVQSCLAVMVDGLFILFDAGAGSAQEADKLGLPLSDLEAVFLTHLHSDHIADLPLMASKGWRYGRSNTLPVYGPVGTIEVVAGLNQGHRLDRVYRYANIKGFSAPLDIAAPVGYDIATPGPAGKKMVVEFSNGLKVFCFGVEHAPVEPAFGYRIEYNNRVVVISGDTRACENVARHAQGADLLFHEAFNKNLVNKMLTLTADTPVAAQNKSIRMIRSLGKKVQTYHTSPVSAAEIASRARVKKLVFTHIDPPLGPFPVRQLITQPFFLKGVSDAFKGDVAIAEDGMYFVLKLK
jgi:ribonuclease Z